MASSTLIGTAPDQVPTNGDLGDLAFQNKEFVEFYDGRGGLGHLDITAISRQLSVSAIDVFIYDTSKDSDGGAWRKRCQHTSWYNEPLNTAIRGSRREFPSVAVIVATTTSVTIHDGDDPAMPMWMVFQRSLGYPGWTHLVGGNHASDQISCVSASNAIIVTGLGNGPNETAWAGLYYCNFLLDAGYKTNSSGNYTYNGWFNFPISQRYYSYASDSQFSTKTVPFLVNSFVKDVAMTVLPNAPIDPATGLPIPTIGVGCTGGLSIIQHDGTVTNRSSAWFSDGGAYEIAFDDRGGYWYTNAYYAEGSGFPNHAGLVAYAPSVRESGNLARSDGYGATNGVHYLQGTDNGTSTYWGLTEGLWLVDANNNHANAGKFSLTSKQHVGTQYGLSVFDTNYSIGSHGMARYVTSKYNTGWMPGDIKGAWLSDTTQETLVGAELITNGTFTSDLSGWTYNDQDQNMIISNVSGKIRLVRNDSTGTQANPKQVIATIPGREYVISYTATLNISGQNNSIVNITDSVTGLIRDWRPTGSGTHFLQFTATGRQTTILLAVDNNGDNVDFDDITCRLADPDRSVNNKGLQVFGNITKTPVAAGADLVEYSGFSSSNYLQQPYNTALDFGTESFFIAGWFYGGSNDNYIFRRGDVAIGLTTLGYLYYYNSLAGNINNGTNTISNAWKFVCVSRTGGVTRVYLNGTLVGSGADSYNWTTAQPSPALWIGNLSAGDSRAFTGSMALWRVSATAPSDAQIKKMYEDEKVLFQDNAKATLYGTSDAVTALAYDEDTNLLHVGTSSGRSVFNGLRRVDNTTDAVGACISAAGGLVVED